MRLRRIFMMALAAALGVAACSPFDYGYKDPELPEKEQAPELEPEEEPYFVPVIRVSVEDGRNVESKDEYLNAEVTVEETEDLVYSASARIKGRGNATWGYEKKPYKLKFDEKAGLLGFAANKEWVLLAEYCDKSLMRTTYMCELARTAGLPYPINCRHVNLYLNDEYLGVYLLTDQVEKKKNRVDIEDDGFLFENDNYFWEEPLNFMTDYREYWYTFKYPDPEDGEITAGSAAFSFITGFMNDFESALYGDDFKDTDKGYRKYIDVETFAKWFLVQELIANLEPNMYYVLPSREARLQIAPVWDAEWSMGLAHREDEYAGWAWLPTQPDRYKAIWSSWKYFGRLFEDSYFVDAVRNEWAALEPQIPEFQSRMKKVADNISEAQVMNFQKWPILDRYISVGLVRFGSWEKEVEYVEKFFADRVDWLDAWLSSLPATRSSADVLPHKHER